MISQPGRRGERSGSIALRYGPMNGAEGHAA
jgi:hypothetical protein